MSQKPLIDFTDKELYDALRHEIKSVHYFAASYQEEIWTYVIAIATLINAIATLILVLKSVGSW
jgi:hypothetical protein